MALCYFGNYNNRSVASKIYTEKFVYGEDIYHRITKVRNRQRRQAALRFKTILCAQRKALKRIKNVINLWKYKKIKNFKIYLFI